MQDLVSTEECDYRVATVARAPMADHSLKKLKNTASRVEYTDIVTVSEDLLHVASCMPPSRPRLDRDPSCRRRTDIKNHWNVRKPTFHQTTKPMLHPPTGSRRTWRSLQNQTRQGRTCGGKTFLSERKFSTHEAKFQAWHAHQRRWMQTDRAVLSR